ncbi:transglycosylase SLT domain-containing protein [Paenalkalicoccus suaedae]|uniref:Transglycosylase SLT domain-containing protein n=1 Tax=Paenalkalicoccus suaedae TaxID=2592382 RepID=A0A859FJ51_9BACI|nr:transglycosylase SLT domain-containing protein [Paenalkalicoccus suaedae]QKS72445.1 transglycosylase SLT domain-containing protein [Paenalkalicoccus suaedae]
MAKVVLATVLFIFGVLLFSAMFADFFETTPSTTTSVEQEVGLTNPSYSEINQLLTDKALENNVPPEVVKAVAYRESRWRQFEDGEPLISFDNGIGIMQVTDTGYDTDRLKTDISYNIDIGIEILLDKAAMAGSTLPTIANADWRDIEYWYFPVMAYNGLVHANSPIIRATGERNQDAYQERVFQSIRDFNPNISLSPITISLEDLNYDENYLLRFETDVLTLDTLGQSRYTLEEGEELVVVENGARLHDRPSDEYAEVSQVEQGDVVTLLDVVLPEDSHFSGRNQISKSAPWFLVESSDGDEGYMEAYTLE